MKIFWERLENHSVLYFIGSSANIFTSVLYNIYYPPDGFCFDIFCSGMVKKLNDDTTSSNYNIEKKVSKKHD